MTATALVSVSDKRGIADFCRGLAALRVRILSTGGSARELRARGIEVTDVSAHTGFAEIMDGRVKTLHPKIHAGILARRGHDDATLAELGIDAIDLVAVNLYPFAKVTAEPGCDFATAVENIDIGGPALLRAAAKNHADVSVVVDPDDYAAVLAEMQSAKKVSARMRFALAQKAFSHCATYDAAIANYFSAQQQDAQPFPQELHLHFHKQQALRYGENPHQPAALYRRAGATAGIACARALQGKELSYNNIADAEAAFACAMQFRGAHACVIVKHANPCGAALSDSQTHAYERAFATDSESAFGGIIAFNRALDAEAAHAIIARQFAEVIIAPQVLSAARDALAAKKEIRVLECAEQDSHALEYRAAGGGLLAQQVDAGDASEIKIAGAHTPGDAQMRDLLFAWRIAKFVKSNAIVCASGGATIGVGAGQMSRINSARIAAQNAQRANLQLRGAVMASDAFFPFRDGVDAAAEAGISALIQPGGSRRDAEIIAAADEHGMAMVFTGMRHFRH